MTATVSSGKRICCRYPRWHDWQTSSTPDGQRYRACSVCDKDEPSGFNNPQLGGPWGLG